MNPAAAQLISPQNLRSFEMYVYARDAESKNGDEQYSKESLSCKTMYRWLHSGYTEQKKKPRYRLNSEVFFSVVVPER